MHGVAFNAQILTAENGDPGPEDGIILGNDGAVYKAGWDGLVASGARIINNSWGIGIGDQYAKGAVIRRSPTSPSMRPRRSSIPSGRSSGTLAGGAYQGAIDAARSGADHLCRRQ